MKNNQYNDWAKSVTSSLQDNMEGTANDAYQNGCDILNDAKLLYDSKRFARATTLAILAEEELSKAFILLTCAREGRWDSNIYKALKKHPEKQAISQAMRKHMDWFIANYKKVMEMNRYSPVPMAPALTPREAEMDEFRKKTKRAMKNPKRDRFKQSSIYVDFDKMAKSTSTPSKISQEDADQCLVEAKTFKVIVEVLMGNTSNISEIYDG